MNLKSLIYRCLVASLCLVCLIVTTYAWFNRHKSYTQVTGNSIKYEDTIDTNGNGANLSMTQYRGTENSDGTIDYAESTAKSVTIEPGKKVHFRTKISNTGDTCDVTLLLRNTTYSNFGANLKFGVLSPMNTLKHYDSGVDVPLVRKVTVKNDEPVDVDWYIYLDKSYSGSAGTITLGNMYLFAN